MEKFIAGLMVMFLAACLMIAVLLLQALAVQYLVNYLFAPPYTDGYPYVACLALLALCRLLVGHGGNTFSKRV